MDDETKVYLSVYKINGTDGSEARWSPKGGLSIDEAIEFLKNLKTTITPEK